MEYDVAIIGGGPAGSTAAALLAQNGRKVVVFEREKFPRFHIGESMLPYSMPIFERLGVREKLDGIALKKVGGEVATSCGEHSVKFFFKQGFRLKQQSAYQVVRADFDKILLDNAVASGAEVREETTVEKVAFEPESVSLEICGKDRAKETIRAKYLLDCSGRNAVVGSHFKLRQSYAHLQKFSIYAHFENVLPDRAECGGAFTHLIRGSDYWIWIIPVTNERTSIGVVMDTSVFKKLKKTPEQAFEEFLGSPEMQRRMSKANRITPVYSTGDYSYRNTSFAGDRWLLAGDAAGFIDPVWSTGVFIAVMTGEKSADVLHRVLDKPSERAVLFRRYERGVNRVMDMYLRLVTAWYRPEFVEVFMNPTERFQLAPAVNAALAGNVGGGFSIWWRMQLFYIVLYLQRFYALCPRLSLFHTSSPQTAS